MRTVFLFGLYIHGNIFRWTVLRCSSLLERSWQLRENCENVTVYLSVAFTVLHHNRTLMQQVIAFSKPVSAPVSDVACSQITFKESLLFLLLLGCRSLTYSGRLDSAKYYYS